jgi:hypothetical protein
MPPTVIDAPFPVPLTVQKTAVLPVVKALEPGVQLIALLADHLLAFNAFVLSRQNSESPARDCLESQYLTSLQKSSHQSQRRFC